MKTINRFAVVIGIFAISLIGIAAGFSVDFQPSIDESLPIESSCGYGLDSGCVHVYTDAVTGNIRHRTVDSSNTVTSDRIATSSEIISYSSFVDFKAGLSGRNKLRNAYATLKLWESQTANIATNWSGFTTTQKDSFQQTLFSRMAIFFANFADLLLVMDFKN